MQSSCFRLFFSLDALGYATKIYSTLMRNAGSESEMNVCDIERDG